MRFKKKIYDEKRSSLTSPHPTYHNLCHLLSRLQVLSQRNQVLVAAKKPGVELVFFIDTARLQSRLSFHIKEYHHLSGSEGNITIILAKEKGCSAKPIAIFISAKITKLVYAQSMRRIGEVLDIEELTTGRGFGVDQDRAENSAIIAIGARPLTCLFHINEALTGSSSGLPNDHQASAAKDCTLLAYCLEYQTRCKIGDLMKLFYINFPDFLSKIENTFKSFYGPFGSASLEQRSILVNRTFNPEHFLLLGLKFVRLHMNGAPDRKHPEHESYVKAFHSLDIVLAVLTDNPSESFFSTNLPKASPVVKPFADMGELIQVCQDIMINAEFGGTKLRSGQTALERDEESCRQRLSYLVRQKIPRLLIANYRVYIQSDLFLDIDLAVEFPQDSNMTHEKLKETIDSFLETYHPYFADSCVGPVQRQLMQQIGLRHCKSTLPSHPVIGHVTSFFLRVKATLSAAFIKVLLLLISK